MPQVSSRGEDKLRPAGWLVALALALAPCLEAQDSGKAVIRQIAGQHLYLDISSGPVLAPRDTLALEGSTTPQRLLVVVAGDSTRAVVTFAASPFPMTRGMTIGYLVRPGGAGPDVAAPPPVPSQAGYRARPVTPMVSGRLSLAVDGQRTRTSGLGPDPEIVERDFATPVAAARLRISRLPGQFEIDANLSASYRYATGGLVDPETLVRIYQLSLSKTFNSVPLSFKVGRFYNPYEYFSGYWDGGLIYLGGRRLGGGVAAGFEPDRGNDGFSSSFPKASLFVQARGGTGGTGYRTDLSLHTVLAQDTTPAHNYAGWALSAYSGRTSINTSVQLDRNPDSSRLALTRLLANLAFPVGPSITVRGGFSRRQPYRLGPARDVTPYRRDRVSGSIAFAGHGLSATGEVGWNRQEGLSSIMSYSGNLYAPRTVADVSLGLSGSHWTAIDSPAGYRERGLVLSVRGGRSFGTVETRLGYQYYRAEFGVTSDVSHLIDAGVNLRVSSTTRATLGIRTRRGEHLSGTGLSGSIWWVF